MIKQTEMDIIEDAIAQADIDGEFGFDVIRSEGDDITLRAGGIEDVMNFSVAGGVVIWWDFTHQTPIGPIDDIDKLAEEFKTLFRASDSNAVESYIQARAGQFRKVE